MNIEYLKIKPFCLSNAIEMFCRSANDGEDGLVIIKYELHNKN